jgi:PhnB protein
MGKEKLRTFKPGLRYLSQSKERTMQINPYLFFNGNCEEAFKFYAQCLGGKIETMLPYTGTPAEAQVPPDWRNKVLHASLVVGNQVLLASDAPPGRFEIPQGFFVSLGVKDPTEADRIFQALAENGNVRMPIQKTFWATLFGMVVDRFGIPWMINCG